MIREVAGPCLMTLTIDVGAPVELGEIAGQARRFIPLLGGSVEGDFRGTVLPGGADWQVIAPDGQLEISARYMLELEQGRVEVRSEGLRAGPPDVLARLAAGETVPAGDYYFRTSMRFFTASHGLDHFNRLLAIAVGNRLPGQVVLDVHPVL